jgi:hypothetical protein
VTASSFRVSVPVLSEQHVHRRRLVDGRKAGGQDALFRQPLRAQRGCEREGRGQRHRHRRQHRDQRQRDELRNRQADRIGISEERDHDHAVHRGEVAHHAEDRFLLRARHMGGPHQLGRSTEFRARSRRRHLGQRLAAPNQRASKRLASRPGLDRQRLAGDHRLVEKDIAGDEAHIGGDDAAERQLHQIAWNQLRRGNVGPAAVAPHARGKREARFEGGDGRLSPPLVKESERGVEDQQHCDDARLDVLAEKELQHDRRFEEAGNRRHELAQDQAQRMDRRIGRRIRAAFGEPALRLGAREPRQYRPSGGR